MLGTGRRVRRRRLGEKAVGGLGAGRLYGVSPGDGVDSASAQFFVNSSLAHVLLFRRRIKSVADALKGIRQQVFSPGRLEALHRYWREVCRQGPCGPVLSLEPWVNWVPPDLHGFFEWVFDTLKLLNDFVRQVVVVRRDSALHRWASWLREDLSSAGFCPSLSIFGCQR